MKPVEEAKKYKGLASEMQKVYLKGTMRDGTHKYSSNTTEISNKLLRFFEIYGEYSDEEIIDATKRYIASCHGNYRYTPALNNFVWKMKDEVDEDGQVHKYRHSILADFLEDKEDSPSHVDAGSEWTTKMI